MTPRKQLILAVAIILAVTVSVGTFAYLFSAGKTTPGGTHVQNILVVASVTGFNDSVDHGVPANPWPVVHVAKGALVNITVWNDDKQPHGFQVSHYFDSSIQTVAPGQRLNVSFIANETGTFRIYCSIFCTVHWAMQSGQLVVS